MKSNKLILVVLAALSLGALVACEEEFDETTPKVAPKVPKAAPDPATTPEPEKKAVDTSYSYDVLVNGQPRRDPFKTYFDELNSEERVDTGKLTELQKIDLDKLKLVAVVVGTATPMAMVEDPGGKGHTIKIGTLVGKRLGQVKHIRRGEVVVQEEFRDFTGKRIPQLKELHIDGGAPTSSKP
jgi:type IV pilus assembly protein PilP